MKLPLTLIAIFAALPAWAGSEAGNVRRLQLPRETATLRPGSGADLANAFCLTCHSADYITTQPPLNPAVWKTEVQKMMAKFGAPVPAANIDPIVAYLAHAYGAEPSKLK